MSNGLQRRQKSTRTLSGLKNIVLRRAARGPAISVVVVALATLDQIVLGIAARIEKIISGPAQQGVIPQAAIEFVVIRTAVQKILTIIAVQDVRSIVAKKVVVAGTPL